MIRGTRLTVEYIVNLLAHGATAEEIIKEYEGLTLEDIRACLLFSAKSLASTAFMPLEEAAQMRFLVDECTGPAVAQWLRKQGHDVFSVSEESRGTDDGTIIRKAFGENPAWEPGLGESFSCFQRHGKPELAFLRSQAGAWERETRKNNGQI